MIHLITGAVNQGKSTGLLAIYRRLGTGDGFYNRRILQGNETIGQAIIHMATGASRVLAYREGFIPRAWNEQCRYGPFSFAGEGFDFGRRIIQKALEKQIIPIFIDEIGPLELAGMGFDPIMFQALQYATELYVVVRENCIGEVIRRYAFKQYEVLQVRADL